MVRCKDRGNKLFSAREYCKKDNKNCGALRWVWCKGIILGIFMALALAYFFYGIVFAWQGAEDRGEIVISGQVPVVSERLARLQAKVREELEMKELVIAILECESSNRPDVWGDGGKSYGIAQIQERTWDYLAPKAGIKGDWKDPGDQVALLEWAIENGYGGYWTCYRKLTEGI